MNKSCSILKVVLFYICSSGVIINSDPFHIHKFPGLGNKFCGHSYSASSIWKSKIENEILYMPRKSIFYVSFLKCIHTWSIYTKWWTLLIPFGEQWTLVSVAKSNSSFSDKKTEKYTYFIFKWFYKYEGERARDCM